MTLYSGWAHYYDVLHASKPYDAEVARLHEVIRRHAPEARSLLDVTCGTAGHLQRLRTHFEAEGLDASGPLLEIARQKCPDIKFHEVDMEHFALPRRFDVIICMFSVIGFAATIERLELTIANMARHLHPKGLLLVEPWFSPASFWTDTITANYVDQPQLKIAWLYTSWRQGDQAVLHNQFLVGTPAGIQHHEETHVLGLFSEDQYTSAVQRAGLQVCPVDPSGWPRGIHVGIKPG
jgi:ubiquinone/menaquinone biosynthesis C-methylase UbiE